MRCLTRKRSRESKVAQIAISTDIFRSLKQLNVGCGIINKYTTPPACTFNVCYVVLYYVMTCVIHFLFIVPMFVIFVPQDQFHT